MTGFGDITCTVTGKRFPGTRGNGDVLCGVGARIVKVGFIQVNVYAVGFYVSPSDARTALSAFRKSSHEELIGDGAFWDSLISGRVSGCHGTDGSNDIYL